jgi:hypothetical protein
MPIPRMQDNTNTDEIQACNPICPVCDWKLTVGVVENGMQVRPHGHITVTYDNNIHFCRQALDLTPCTITEPCWIATVLHSPRSFCFYRKVFLMMLIMFLLLLILSLSSWLLSLVSDRRLKQRGSGLNIVTQRSQIVSVLWAGSSRILINHS